MDTATYEAVKEPMAQMARIAQVLKQKFSNLSTEDAIELARKCWEVSR